MKIVSSLPSGMVPLDLDPFEVGWAGETMGRGGIGGVYRL